MTVAALHREVMRGCSDVVEQVRTDQLDRPTPCADWDLADLLEHMIGQNHGFAAAVEGARTGAGADRGRWAPQPLGDDPSQRWRSSAAAVLAAFASSSALELALDVPELGPEPLPARRAVAAHTIDLVVHGWDVAVTIGVRPVFGSDLLADVSAMVDRIPDGAARTVAGAQFRPSVPRSEDVPVLDAIGARLGRNPGWTD